MTLIEIKHFRDAVILLNAHQRRPLFSLFTLTCFPSDPIDSWIKYKDDMSDDILRQIHTRTSKSDLQLSDEIYNEALILIEDMCLMISNNFLHN